MPTFQEILHDEMTVLRHRLLSAHLAELVDLHDKRLEASWHEMPQRTPGAQENGNEFVKLHHLRLPDLPMSTMNPENLSPPTHSFINLPNQPLQVAGCEESQLSPPEGGEDANPHGILADPRHREPSRDGMGPTPSNHEELKSKLKQAEMSVKMAVDMKAAARKAVEEERAPWTQSNIFINSIALFIVANAVTMGFEVDYERDHPQLFYILENIYTAVFLIEMLLHFHAEGVTTYFNQFTNWLDFILVVAAVADTWVIKPIGSNANIRIVSILRLFRLARLARMFRLFRMFKELTLLLQSFASGARTLGWSMSFLLLIVYMFAIFARAQIGTKYLCGDREIQEGDQCPAEQLSFMYDVNEDIGDQEILFGSIPKTMLTLFMCLSEGCGFDIVHPTSRSTPWLGIFWFFFSVTTTFGILNLIVGLFCENTIKVAVDYQRDFHENVERKREEKVQMLVDAFKAVNESKSGNITRDEFNEAICCNERVIEALTSLGLENEKDLFGSFDADGNGTLEFHEFFDGVMFMTKGHDVALAKDIVPAYLRLTSLQKEVKHLKAVMVTRHDLEGVVSLILGCFAEYRQRCEELNSVTMLE